MKENIKCPKCGGENIGLVINKNRRGDFFCVDCEDYFGGVTSEKIVGANEQKNIMRENFPDDYPQSHEPNEYRYLSPAWLDEIAKGLTAGQEKYPGETWRQIPAKEHAWRAVRHLMLYLKGDKADTHLINAAMRTMMAFETDAAENDVIEWEKLMREKGCG